MSSVDIYEASRNGLIHRVAELIQDGVDLQAFENAVYDDFVVGTPLLYACKANQFECARLLIQAGACVTQADSEGVTPLHAAAVYGTKNLVRLLLENGADINQQDHYGCTPLYGAISENKVENAEELLMAGADANLSCVDGFSPLHLTVEFPPATPAGMQLLFRFGARLDQLNGDGHTAEEAAVIAQRPDLAQQIRYEIIRREQQVLQQSLSESIRARHTTRL